METKDPENEQRTGTGIRQIKIEDEVIDLRLQIAHWSISSSAQQTVIRQQNKTISELHDVIDTMLGKLHDVASEVEVR